MKTKINKIAFLMFGLFIFACSTLKKENVTVKLECQQLLSKKVEMRLPVPFRVQKDNYEEGVIYFYSFVDSAYIIVLQGTMMELLVDKYNPQKIEMRNKRKISVGFENNKFWRKDVFEGVRIYYDNVSLKNKRLYDEVLDKIKISSFKKK